MTTQSRRETRRDALINRALELLGPLTRFARTEINAYEAMGYLPRGALQPEDIVDTALLEALQQADEAPMNRLYPWLRGFVRRVIQREVREGRRQMRDRSLFEPVGTGRPDEEGGPPRRLIDVIPDPSSPIPEQVALSREFQQLLGKLLCQLPADWRKAFLLHVRDGLPLTEVARREGISVAEARRRIERAREYLRARLADEYQDGEFPPPTEDIFDLLERIPPTPDQVARTRERLQAAA